MHSSAKSGAACVSEETAGSGITPKPIRLSRFLVVLHTWQHPSGRPCSQFVSDIIIPFPIFPECLRYKRAALAYWDFI